MSWETPAWILRKGVAKAPTSVAGLAAMNDGTVMRFCGPDGLVLTARKTNDRRWAIFGGGTSGESLAGMAAVEMVRREP